jgi:CO/xanthine dehydrogenase FAD-binding subunit
MDGFFRDWMQPDLAVGEIVAGIELAVPPPGSGWGFEEVARRHGDFGLVGAAVVVSVDGGVITHARIGLLGAGLTPIRARAVEGSLVGRPYDGDHLEIVTAELRSDAAPLDDQHATAEERRHLARIVTHRALVHALGRARAAS